MLKEFELYNGTLQNITHSKKLITTLNAHSFNTIKKDPIFRKALQASDMLLPDGISVVLATWLLLGKKIKKIAGDDLFRFEMQRVYEKQGKCFFLGSSESTLQLIKNKAESEFPGLEVHGFSPPYKAEFTEQESQDMIEAVNKVSPDVLFVGMTAPKQEKWAYTHFERLNAGHICCIGAVFDFYAGTIQRAPKWVISAGMEWFYRLMCEPRRMWKRYLIGNTLFVKEILKEKIIESINRPRLAALQSETVKSEKDYTFL